jgi:cyclophilin family peptidyl-prolyl cis-trans isomerase
LKVVEGQDVVDKISRVPHKRQDKPQKDVVLNAVKIERE